MIWLAWLILVLAAGVVLLLFLGEPVDEIPLSIPLSPRMVPTTSDEAAERRLAGMFLASSETSRGRRFREDRKKWFDAARKYDSMKRNGDV